ncbi:MAG: hypothetical protein GY798_18040 [Hyphomicrobiales bacterium]|nr:hypothetical protein [Hyphomicrobiales bacterium]
MASVEPAVSGGHAFAVGHEVRLAASPSFARAAPGPYRIVALLPERDGVVQYRVKSDNEACQRVVRQDQLRSQVGG